MKVGDLVRLRVDIIGRSTRHRGIIIGFDEENDPLVLWSKWKFPEPNFRSHVAVISKS